MRPIDLFFPLGDDRWGMLLLGVKHPQVPNTRA